jgi:hypothetical protein
VIASEAQSQVPDDLAAAAQWAHVQLLSPDSQLEVRTSRKTKGRLSSVTATTLVVIVDGQEVNFSRSEIREIKVRTDSSTTREVVAVGIGASSGLATAAIVDGVLTDGNGVSKTAAVHSSLIGALAGLLWGSLKQPYRTIYKVR